MNENTCERCSGRGEVHSQTCVVRTVIFNDKKTISYSKSYALQAAIDAVERFLKKEKKRR